MNQIIEPLSPTSEESLDPTDWEEMRQLGHRMVDDMLDYLQNVRQRPVWQPIPSQIKERLNQPVPLEPQPVEQIYQEFLRDILPHPGGNIHPRFWGWVMGAGTPLGMLAEMLAAGMNPNMGGGEHVAVYVEAQVVEWLKQMLGYPSQASGLLISGGSMANLIGLNVARNAKAGFDVRKQGLGSGQQPLALYASQETHSSVQKAVEMLGLGSQALRKIPVDAEYRIDMAALQAAIAADRFAGRQPFCLVGNAGTVNTGAFDDLERLADLAEREGLWYHVDGAFGALAALDPGLRSLTAGMERADSLAFDLHKWLSTPFEAACILVRDAQAHYETFSLTPAYLSHGERGLAAGSHWYSDYGIQLSRGFRALKVWMSLKEHGVRKFGRMVRKNVEQARYLASLVDDAPQLELLAPTPLNIVCFRYKAAGFDPAALNALNEELLIRLHESGAAAPTYTTLDGNYALRVANVNHRSQMQDFDILVREVIRLGEELVKEMNGNGSAHRSGAG